MRLSFLDIVFLGIMICTFSGCDSRRTGDVDKKAPDPVSAVSVPAQNAPAAANPVQQVPENTASD